MRRLSSNPSAAQCQRVDQLRVGYYFFTFAWERRLAQYAFIRRPTAARSAVVMRFQAEAALRYFGVPAADAMLARHQADELRRFSIVEGEDPSQAHVHARENKEFKSTTVTLGALA